MEAIFIILIVLIIARALGLIFKKIIEFFTNTIVYFKLLKINKAIQILEKNNNLNSFQKTSNVTLSEILELKESHITAKNEILEKDLKNKLHDIFIIESNK